MIAIITLEVQVAECEERVSGTTGKTEQLHRPKWCRQQFLWRCNLVDLAVNNF
jgi:hypothetical protein